MKTKHNTLIYKEKKIKTIDLKSHKAHLRFRKNPNQTQFIHIKDHTLRKTHTNSLCSNITHLLNKRLFCNKNLSIFVRNGITMLFSILNFIFFLAFTAFAYLNLNDKDSWLWISIYMIAAVLCLLSAFKIHYLTLSLIMMIFYISYALILFFSKNGVWDWLTKYKKESLVQSMQATKPHIEKTREFFGLLIISGALFMNYWTIS